MAQRALTLAEWNWKGGWVAWYSDQYGRWRMATDAQGQPITCLTKQLAASVARYRRRRLKIWRN